MKGIILAGGLGTRLYPLTKYTSKHLLPINDKPMVYYPLSTLMLSGIKEIALVSTGKDLPNYKKLLGDGSQWGINISFIEQTKPRGIADVFLVCEDFIANSPVSLILGDNIFHGNLRLDDVFSDFSEGALIFAYSVNDPQNFGVVVFDEQGEIIDLIEKPDKPISNYAIPGFYIYDENVVNYAKQLVPSPRGELEITDLNKMYFEKKALNLRIMGRGIAWLDTGNIANLQEASVFINSVEKMQSNKIGCPEEIAFRKGYITHQELSNLIEDIPDCEYKNYISKFAEDIQTSQSDFLSNIDKLQP